MRTFFHNQIFSLVAIATVFNGCLDSNGKDRDIQVFERKKVSFSTPQTKSLYAGTPNDPIYPYQWHLEILEIENIWSKYTGKGVSVAVVDSGVEALHPDLYNNIDFNKSYRYSDGSNDPSPDRRQLQNDPYTNGHGTACAGIIGASGWNGEGVIGVAPCVDIVGLNPFSTGLDGDFEDALGRLDIDISNNSWGGDISNVLYDDPPSMRGIEQGIKYGRQGKGIIYLFASGNEGHNANYSTLHGSPYVFNIGAVTRDGEVPLYSNFGDNILVVAPAGDEYRLFQNWGIFTTDLLGMDKGFDSYRIYTPVLRKYQGDYTGFMNGTSSAVPVASGVVALMLEANPNLTYRDVKYILIHTAIPWNIYKPEYMWSRNGAGILYSPYYGFGIINPPKAVEMAENFESLPPQQEVTKFQISNTPIPDNSEEGITSEIEIGESLKIEHVQIEVDIEAENISDIDIDLISPSGTVSKILFDHLIIDGNLEGWIFNSLKFVDEDSKGIWTIRVADTLEGSFSYLKSWKIRILGRKE